MSNLSNNPSNSKEHPKGSDTAANVIRQRISKLYDQEPEAIEEIEESFAPHKKPISKHQKYMQAITNSGMSLADIQTAWHRYYSQLPDSEKHEVWNEFYAEHDHRRTNAKHPAHRTDEVHQPQEQQVLAKEYTATQALTMSSSDNLVQLQDEQQASNKTYQPGNRTVKDVKKQLLSTAQQKAKKRLKAKQHFQSLLFGVGMGSIVILLLLFGFFNDRFIAPFITPSKSVSSTPIIIDSSTIAVDPNPKIIIPKINVEIPVVYDEPSIEERAIQNALERGVVHYATTPYPGEKGNAVIFGHSSNNILNKGQYKFAFVLLNKLETGDTFYLTKDGIRYSYRIYDKKIVKPTDIGVLSNANKPATVTLITCDPPGTSLNRLIVIGEQITPNPDNNKQSTADTSADQSNVKVIPSNAPSLWQRIKNALTGN